MPDGTPHWFGSIAPLFSIVLSEAQLDSVLDLVTTFAKDTIPGAASVSVSLLRDGKLITPASTDKTARRIDLGQYQSNKGPCVSAAFESREVHVPDLPNDPRWPEVAKEAAELGIASVLSLPLPIAGTTIGGLNIYSRKPEGYGEVEVGQARDFARQAATVLANVQAFESLRAMNEQLRDALVSRDVIGQAKGILMEREHMSSDQAFDVLRRASQRSNIKLREIAERVVQSVEGRSSTTK